MGDEARTSQRAKNSSPLREGMANSGLTSVMASACWNAALLSVKQFGKLWSRREQQAPCKFPGYLQSHGCGASNWAFACSWLCCCVAPQVTS